MHVDAWWELTACQWFSGSASSLHGTEFVDFLLACVCQDQPLHFKEPGSWTHGGDLLLAGVFQDQPLHFMERFPVHAGCGKDSSGLHTTTHIVQRQHVIV